MATIWKKRYPPTLLVEAGTHIWAVRKNEKTATLNSFDFNFPFITFRKEDKIFIFGILRSGKLTLSITDDDGNVTQETSLVNPNGTDLEVLLWVGLTELTINKRAVTNLGLEVVGTEKAELENWGLIYGRQKGGWTKRIPPSSVWTKRN